MATGCFNASVTLDLQCSTDEDCAGDQVCVGGTCQPEGTATSASTTDGSTSGDDDGGGDTSCSASEENTFRCAPDDQLKYQVCVGGQWISEPCDTACMMDPSNGDTCSQAGVCVEGSQPGTASCLCADSIGGICDPDNGSQRSCISDSVWEFCEQTGSDRFLQYDCGCRCGALGYSDSVVGPCTEETLPGVSAAPDCMCADGVTGASCSGGLNNSVFCRELDLGGGEFEYYLDTCVNGTVYEINCKLECARQADELQIAWDGQTAICNNMIEPVRCDCGFN